MVDHIGPAAALREFAEHAPELIELLPRLPGALLDATRKIRTMERSMDRQNRELRDLKAQVAKLGGRRRLKQASGVALLLLGSLLLWNLAGTGEDDVTTVAGLASAALGSLLLLRT